MEESESESQRKRRNMLGKGRIIGSRERGMYMCGVIETDGEEGINERER